MGRVMAPVDINKESLIGEMKKRIDKGLFIVMVYSLSCGHCHTYMPKYKSLINNPNRAVEAGMVEASVWDKAKSELNLKNAEIEGYPSVIAINKNYEAVNFQEEDGHSTNTVPDHNNMKMMNSIIENGLPEAEPKVNADAITESNVETEPKSLNVSRPYNSQVNKNMNKAIQNMPPMEEGSTLPPNILEDSIIENNKKEIDSLVYKPAPKPMTGGAGCGCMGLKGFRGGSSLYGLLTSVASEAAAPALLLGTAAYLSKRGKKTRKVLKRKVRQIKRTLKRTSK